MRILVTGANKGIGLAIVAKLLSETTDAFVYLGSRDFDKGQQAVDQLVAEHPHWQTRVEPIEIDVSNKDSILNASKKVVGSLYGLICNAGIAKGSPRQVLQTNFYGVIDCVDAFSPLFVAYGDRKPRIVIVSSAAGPTFVADCTTQQRQDALCKAPASLDFILKQATQFLDSMSLADTESNDAASTALTSLGFPPYKDGLSYGASKALINTYTLFLSHLFPNIITTACTPGFIATDLFSHSIPTNGKSLVEMGAKPPSAGAVAPVFLTLAKDEEVGSGWFYGSDAKRSPLDRYRAPGTAAYDGL